MATTWLTTQDVSVTGLLLFSKPWLEFVHYFACALALAYYFFPWKLCKMCMGETMIVHVNINSRNGNANHSELNSDRKLNKQMCRINCFMLLETVAAAGRRNSIFVPPRAVLRQVVSAYVGSGFRP